MGAIDRADKALHELRNALEEDMCRDTATSIAVSLGRPSLCEATSMNARQSKPLRKYALARDVDFSLEIEPFTSPALTPSVLRTTAPLLYRGVPLWNALLSDDVPREARDVFARGRDERSSLVLPSDVVFPKEKFPIHLTLTRRDASWTLTVETEDELRSLADLVSGAWEDEGTMDETVSELLDEGVLVPRATLGRPPLRFESSGIYRLQHASLLFRTESTSIITDPNAAFAFEQPWFKFADQPPIDAVLISHSHTDHFCLGTLLNFPRTTTMIVPVVERPSMLTFPMGDLLRAAGFERVIDAAWYSSHRIGDIEVSVYPFYGEQPWNTFAAPTPELRNCGNTYVVTAGGIKTWFLIDSGQEFGHAMHDVCTRVQSEHGEIDVVLSNLRQFMWGPGQIDGSGRFLYCFPDDVLRAPETWPINSAITFGSEGIRQFLERLKPTVFLPYAHWWQPRESGSHRVDGKETERDMVDAIRLSPSGRCDLVTKLCEWNVGDCLRFDQGLSIVRSDLG